jgi:biopolymer transport protein TolR
MSRFLSPGRYSSSASTLDQTTFRPQLTSLIDVMTFLLVFLIKSFSVQGDVITPSENLQLPLSITNKPPKPGTSLEITKTNILAEGKVISSLSTIDGTDSLLIKGVFQWMSLERAHFPETSQSREVLIQADREIEYSILKRVMYSCSKAGFTDFTILAVQKE